MVEQEAKTAEEREHLIGWLQERYRSVQDSFWEERTKNAALEWENQDLKNEARKMRSKLRDLVEWLDSFRGLA